MTVFWEWAWEFQCHFDILPANVSISDVEDVKTISNIFGPVPLYKLVYLLFNST